MDGCTANRNWYPKIRTREHKDGTASVQTGPEREKSESKVNSPCPAPSIHSFEISNIILFESLSEKEGET